MDRSHGIITEVKCMKFKKLLNRWWEGTYIPEPPGSPLALGHCKRHWTSTCIHTLVNFYMKHWKWLLPFLVGLTVAIFKD